MSVSLEHQEKQRARIREGLKTNESLHSKLWYPQFLTNLTECQLPGIISTSNSYHPLPLETTSLSLCSLYLCACYFFLKIPQKKWDRMVFVCLCLSYFTWTMPSGYIHADASARFHAFLWLSNIPVITYITFSLSIHPAMDTSIVSLSWLLWIMLKQICGCKYHFKLMILSSKSYPEVELLDQMVVLFLIFKVPPHSFP